MHTIRTAQETREVWGRGTGMHQGHVITLPDTTQRVEKRGRTIAGGARGGRRRVINRAK
jgi:hypothetical protein